MAEQYLGDQPSKIKKLGYSLVVGVFNDKMTQDRKDKKEQPENNYVVCYKWQEGAELFFDRMFISSFEVKDNNFLDKLENKLRVILSNTGMEEENLATVQITGIIQL
jgi:hypothetical protein